MRNLLLAAFVSTISFIGSSQIYYSLGLKSQRVNLLSVYQTEEQYVYDYTVGDYVFTNGMDSTQRKFYSFGPTLCYGYNHEINDKISVAGELEGFLGLLNIQNDGFYFDFSLGARCSYALKSTTYSNAFLRLGVGYGMHRGYEENDLIGLNWRLGYEHDFDIFLLGFALEGNLFLEDLSYYGTVNLENLIGRKMNSFGIAVYCSIGKDQ